MSTSIVSPNLKLVFECWVLNMPTSGIISMSKMVCFCFTLDEEGCQLSWTRRMKIVIGIAKGLRYLHTEIEPPFTISELNSSAVYLTEDFSPKVCTIC